ncbi:MAG: hypothetical protein IJY08_05775 [Clostridia bacterium]|nr:hypothetical protein [Clostridia bacterium]
MNSEACNNNDTKVKTRNCTEELLDGLYKLINTTKQSLLNIIPKVKNSELSAELTSQLNEYGCFSEKVSVALDRCGGEARSCNVVSKMSAKIGIEMNTLADSSDAHLAQMMIEDATMCITDTIRLVRDYENSNCTESALSLARSVVSFQEKTVEKLKSFL